VRFDVLAAMTVKIAILWDVTPRGLLDRNLHTELHGFTHQKRAKCIFYFGSLHQLL
jgi:hypothetical protein